MNSIIEAHETYFDTKYILFSAPGMPDSMLYLSPFYKCNPHIAENEKKDYLKKCQWFISGQRQGIWDEKIYQEQILIGKQFNS